MKAAVSLLTVLAIVGAYVEKPAPEAPAPPPVPPATVQAVLSGIAPEAVYKVLPPALVEFSRLPQGAAVWIEVNGPGGDQDRIVGDKQYFVSNPNGEALLPLPGLARICNREGRWTVLVMANGPEGTAIPLARTTFQLRSEQEQPDSAYLAEVATTD
jgi:hypothetical protein